MRKVFSSLQMHGCRRKTQQERLSWRSAWKQISAYEIVQWLQWWIYSREQFEVRTLKLRHKQGSNEWEGVIFQATCWTWVPSIGWIETHHGLSIWHTDHASLMVVINKSCCDFCDSMMQFLLGGAVSYQVCHDSPARQRESTVQWSRWIWHV